MVSTISSLEQTLTKSISSSGSLNPLADLILLLQRTESPKETSQAVYALYRVFVLLAPRLFSDTSETQTKLKEDEKVVRTWLHARFTAYTIYLFSLLHDPEKALRISALQISFSLLKTLSTAVSQKQGGPQIYGALMRGIVTGVLGGGKSQRVASEETLREEKVLPIDPDVLSLLAKDYLNPYDDLRWFFLREAGYAFFGHFSNMTTNDVISLITRPWNLLWYPALI